MRHLPAVLGAVLIVALPAFAEELPIRPDDAITPGKVFSTNLTDVCGTSAGPNEGCEPGHHCLATGTYTVRHRHTKDSEKRDAFDAYHVQKAGRDFEVDHRVPLALGGADEVANRWPQQGWQHPSFHDKDKLETHVWNAVCRRQTMTLQDGQAIFMRDWIAEFERVFGQPPT